MLKNLIALYKKSRIIASLFKGEEFTSLYGSCLFKVGGSRLYFLGDDEELEEYLYSFHDREWARRRVRKVRGMNLMLIQTAQWSIDDLVPLKNFFYSIEERGNIIIHIPHQNIRIPEEYAEDYLIPDPLDEAIKVADLMVGYLIPEKCYETNMMVFNYSRIFLDVERLPDDELEKEGRGKIYTVASDGSLLRHLSREKREKIEKIYDEYHRTFQELTEKVRRKYAEDTLIIDLHSFTDSDDTGIEICLGFNDASSREKAMMMKAIFEDAGFVVGLNTPYSNSIQPVEGVDSVMIEINKKLYLDETGYVRNERLISAIDRSIGLFMVEDTAREIPLPSHCIESLPGK